MGHDEYDSLEDLVFSRSFREWVLKEDIPEAGFWAGWQTRHPEKPELLMQARAVVYALEPRLRSITREALDDEIDGIMRRLEAGLFEPDASLQSAYGHGFRSRVSIRMRAITVIFCAMCAMGVALFVYTNRHRQVVFHFFPGGGRSAFLHRETGGVAGNPEIALPDGSKVRLEAGSQLYYPEKMSGFRNQRAVFL